MILRCRHLLLIVALLSVVPFSGAQALPAETGSETEALRTALGEAVTSADALTEEPTRAQALANLGEAQALIRDPQAVKTLNRALMVAQDGKYGILKQIARGLARADDRAASRVAFQRAIAATDIITDGVGWKVWRLGQIAQDQVRCGDRDGGRATTRQAVKLIDEAPDEEKDFALILFAPAAAGLARAGHAEAADEAFREAVRMAMDLGDRISKEITLMKIIDAQSEVDIEGAIRSSDEAYRKIRVRISQQIAFLPRAVKPEDPVGGRKLLKRAQAMVDDLGPSVDESVALGDIAEAQARIGDLDAARRTAGRIMADVDPSWKRTVGMGPFIHHTVRALSAIASAQARSGHKTAARGTIHEAERLARQAGDDTSDCLGLIAGAYEKLGDFEAALRAIDAMSGGRSGKEKVDALAMMAEAQARAGDREAARAACRRAIAAAASIDEIRARVPKWFYDNMRYQARKRLAVCLARLGDIDEPLRMAGEMGGKDKLATLSSVMDACTDRKDYSGAVRVADAIESEDTRGVELASVTRAQAEAGDAEGAFRWAARLASPLVRSYALLGIAEGVDRRRRAAEVQVGPAVPANPRSGTHPE